MSDIIRAVKNGGYSMISNFHLKDKRLSWVAKGVMSAMLALSGEYSYEELIELTHDGFRIGKGIEELERYGYFVRTQVGYDKKGFPQIEYTIYEKPFTKESLIHPISEIPSVEDMPGRGMYPKGNEDEEVASIRKRLKLERLVKKCSRDFVEAVFIELCRRDAEFRQMMTAKAFESVCLEVWERYRKEKNCTITDLINMYFDNIAHGFRTASGGNELAGQKERIDISVPCEYDKGK